MAQEAECAACLLTTLYEISTEGLEIERILTEQEGELTPGLEQRIDTLLREGPERVEAAAMVVRGMEASAVACETEVARLAARAKALQNSAERLKRYIAFALDAAFGGKVKTQRFSVWTQKAPDSTVFDLREEYSLDQLDPAYVRVKEGLDKIALKQALQEGRELPEAIYVEHVEGRRYARIK